MKKILFFGTEDFAKSILEQLLDSQQFSVIGVVTKIDQIKGRNEVYKSPVKLLADRIGVICKSLNVFLIFLKAGTK
jgi:methionyl-tRNA formyltransferase